MEEVRANVPEEFKAKLDKIIALMGLYNHRSEYIREALREKMRRDAGLIQGVDLDNM